MYNGLTTADKGALEYAKEECGYEWFARDENEFLYGYTREPNRCGNAWDHEENIHDLLATNMKYFKYIPAGTKLNIDLAIAQIAEMEREQYKQSINPVAVIPMDATPLTWNERINQMTVEEKAPYFVYEDTLIDWEDDYNGESTSTETPIYRSSLASDMFFYVEQDAINATVELLNSPYTEGATK